ncbi:MAG: subclass B3 metallo-beta-lactamase [Planctomycetes bacterium]|nr:subclass B3 metallo-beta-lactamase [Planctomycetota bacterium]
MRKSLSGCVLLLWMATPAWAQNPAPTAIDHKQFLEAAAKDLRWHEPADPVRVIGSIYFVGTQGLSSWLMTTPEGHILLNTGMSDSGPLIEASIRKLGFHPGDIKLLLTCHAHIDHVGGHAHIKQISNCQVVSMREEAALLQSGGKSDFQYSRVAEFQFAKVTPDRLIRDGDTVQLGGVTLTAHLTPGHTQGTTTWVMQATEDGNTYTVVFPDGTGINPGYRLVKQPSYPTIAEDYRRTFQVLGDLKPDIWLTPHPEACDFAAKRKRVETEGVRAWVDPDGYQQWFKARRDKFQASIESESKILGVDK